MTISEELEKIVGYARDEAMRTGNPVATEAHLLLAIIRHGKNSAVDAMRGAGADMKTLRDEVEGPIYRPRSIPYSKLDAITFSRGAGNVLSLAVLEAGKTGAEASAIHLLFAICTAPDSSVRSILAAGGITAGYVREKLPEGTPETEQEEFGAELSEAVQNAFARAVAVSGAVGLASSSGKGVVS